MLLSRIRGSITRSGGDATPTTCRSEAKVTGRVRWLGSLFLVAAAVAGCGSSGGTKAVSSATGLSRVLDARGVGCVGYEDAKPGQTQKYVQHQGYCQIQGESAVLYVFKTTTDLTHWITLGVEAGCSFGLPQVSFVRGPNWIIEPETAAVDQAIKARLGGAVEVHQC